jgi:hypothetical protein
MSAGTAAPLHPRRSSVGHGDQLHGYAVGIDQAQQILAEALDALGCDALGGKPQGPGVERAGRCGEAQGGGLPGSDASLAGVVGPVEKCDNTAGRAGFIAIVQVVGGGSSKLTVFLTNLSPSASV